MVTAVERSSEIALDGVRFRTHGERPINTQLASVFPAKVTLGDTTQDSHPHHSVLSLADYRGGLGRDKSEEAADVDRFWYGNLNPRHKNNLVLQRLATQTAAGPTSTIGVLVEFGDEIYAAYGSDVRKYDNTADSWGNSLHTLPAAATDALVCRVNGTVLLFIACTSGYAYTSDGSSWTDDTENVKYLAFWDDKVFGIDTTGQLRYSTWTTPGDWTLDAQLPLPSDSVTDLFPGEDAAGNSILYAMTTVGLWVHDFDSTKFRQTKLTLPKHSKNGNGSVRWRDKIYIPAGLGCYSYTDGQPNTVITVMGPDRADGLPADKRGTIDQLAASHNELIAVVNNVAADTDLEHYMQTQSSVIVPETGISTILGWDELGWQVLWEGEENASAVGYAIVSNAYDKYRLWWAQGDDVFFMDLPVDITNPDQLPEARYAASGTLETPWFNIGQDEVNKLALHIEAQVSKITADETITLSYALNLDDSEYTELDVINAQPTNGKKHYCLPSLPNRIGIPFFWVRFKIEMARGSNTGLTPHLHSLTLVFHKELDTQRGFQYQLDMTRLSPDGMTPKEQRAEIWRMMDEQKDRLLRFTYRSDDQSSDILREYFVKIANVTDIEWTGFEERGYTQITLVEL